MDTFSAIVLGGLVLVLATFLVLGFWSARRTGDITDKKTRKAWGEMAAIEERDLPQMLEGVNAHRRRRGAEEITRAELQARTEAEQLGRLEHEGREGAG